MHTIVLTSLGKVTLHKLGKDILHIVLLDTLKGDTRRVVGGDDIILEALATNVVGNLTWQCYDHTIAWRARVLVNGECLALLVEVHPAIAVALLVLNIVWNTALDLLLEVYYRIVVILCGDGVLQLIAEGHCCAAHRVTLAECLTVERYLPAIVILRRTYIGEFVFTHTCVGDRELKGVLALFIREDDLVTVGLRDLALLALAIVYYA